jgi:hypothetical protein
VAGSGAPQVVRNKAEPQGLQAGAPYCMVDGLRGDMPVSLG